MTVTDRLQHAGGALPSTLTAAILNSTVSITGEDISGFPDGSVGNFVITLGRGTATEERVLCESRSGNVITVASSGRGWDGTLARDHESGTVIEHTWSTTEADQANAHSSSTAGHGVTVVVGQSETQTLSAKTLVAPVIADFTNAAHDHGDADDGGNIPQSSVTNLTADLALKAATTYVDAADAALDAAKQDESEKGQADGYASLDGDTKVPIAELPTGYGSTDVSPGDHGHYIAYPTVAQPLTSQVLLDSEAPDVLGSVTLNVEDAAYIVMASCAGFTLNTADTARVQYALEIESGDGLLITAPVTVDSTVTPLSGGATVVGTIEVTTAPLVLNFTAQKLNAGPQATTSTEGFLHAVRTGV